VAVKLLRNLDLAVLVLALPVFIAADWPLLGYVAGAGAYLLQRGLQIATRRRADASNDPKTVAGIMAGSLIGRGWLVALIIFGVGIASDDETGLSAAVLFILTFTVYLTVNMIFRPFDEAERKGTL
jgi:hypothetical protein